MDFTIGHILVTAIEWIPPGTLACNGQLVSVSAKRDLFDLLGTTYGGDGVSTFGLPNIPATHSGGPSGPTLNYYIVADGAPYKSGMEALLGEMRLFPVPAPAGSTLAQTWLPSDGRLLALVREPETMALFSLLGTAYGGDGITTFAIPKIPPITIANGPPLTYWICVSGIDPSYDRGDAVTPTYSAPRNYDTYIGTLLQLSYASSVADGMSGAALCRGQILPAASWATLYSVLGNRFGGRINETFALPTIVPSSPNTLPTVLMYEGLYPNR